MRGLLRWLGRLALGAIALVVLVVAIALITAHTDWGRELLRERVEKALAVSLPGGARVGAVEGSILGTLTVREVELDARDGKPLVTVGTVRVDVALWPLLFRTARIHALAAEDVHAYVRPQAPEVAVVALPAPPSPWRVELARVTVHRGALDVEGAAAIALDDIDVAGAGTFVGGALAMTGWLHGRWAARGAELTASATIVLDGRVRVPAALIALGGSTIAATGAVIDLDRPRGALAVATSGDAVAAVFPALVGARGLGALVAAVDLAAAAPTPIEAAAALPATTAVELVAAAAGTRLWASLRGDVARRAGRGVISARGVDLARIPDRRLEGRGDVLAALDAGTDRVRGTLIVRGAVPAVPVREAVIAIDGALAGGLREATALAFGGGDDALHAFAIGAARRAGEAFVIDQRTTRIAASAAGLAIGEQRVTGALAATGSVAGTLAPLAVTVTGVAQGRAIAVDDVAVAAVRMPFALRLATSASGAPAIAVTGHPAATRATYDDIAIAATTGSFTAQLAPVRLDRAHLDATGIRRAATPLGRARADIANRSDGTFGVAATAWPVAGLAIATQAVVHPGEVRTTAALGASQVTLPDGSVWTGRGGAIVVDAHVTVRDVALHSGDATIALRGQLARATGALAAHITADGVDASALAAAYRGRLGGAIDVTRRAGRWGADGTLAVTGFALDRDAAPIDGDARVSLTGRRVTLDARAASTAHGELALALEATGPPDPFDRAAWQALDRSAIHNATITARQVQLARLTDFAVPARPADPTSVPDPARPADPASTSVADPARPAAPAVPAAPAAPAVSTSVADPARPAVSTSAADPMRPAGSMIALTGTVDGTVNLAPAAPSGALAVRGVALPFATLDGDLGVGSLDGDLDLQATARLSDLAAIDLTARLAIPARPFDPASWRQRGRDLLKQGTARLERFAFDAERLGQLGLAGPLAARGIDPHLAGTASATLTVGAAATEARLAIDLDRVTGGGLVAPVSPHIAITAGPQGTHVRAELVGDDGGRALALGVLDGDIIVPADRWLDAAGAARRAPITAQWTLPATPLAPVLALLGRREIAGGTIEGSARIRGSFDEPIIEGARIVARGVAVAPPPGGRTPPVLDELAITGGWDGGTGSVEVTARDASGGRLHARLRGRPALAGLTGSIEAARLDIAPIAAAVPGIAGLPAALASASGVVDGDLALRRGRLTGRLDLARGTIPIDPTVGTLRDATAHIALDDAAIRATVDGTLGGGTVHLTAEAPPDGSSLRATLALANVSPIIALRPRITADVTAQLRVEHSGACRGIAIERGGLCGDIAIASALVALPDRADAPLLDATMPGDILLGGTQPTAPSGPPAPLHPWLVARVALDATQVTASDVAEGVGFRAALHGERLVVSVGNRIGMDGRIVIDNADAEIIGRRYQVDPSSLDFDGSTADPLLDIHMTYQFPALALNVALRGRATNPVPQFSSEPGGYTHDQLFGFFLGGEPGGDPGSQAREAVTGAGSRYLTGKLGRQVSKVLPVKLDTVSCEPSTSATATTATGSCTFGKWFSQRLFLAYRQHLGGTDDENTGDVQVQYRIGGKVLLEGTAGDRGRYGADLLWRHRW